jgi:hypothetical protein
MKAALSALAIAGAVVAAGLAPAGAQAPRDRITRVIVYGTDACPRGGGSDDIVICARRPDSERYRVPRELRDQLSADDPESHSWAATAESLEYVGRGGIESCSTIGPGGASGCLVQLIRTARKEREAAGPPR